MLEQWFSDHCPKCSQRNFVSNGDTSDLTVEDVQGICCWKCGHCWMISDDDGLEDDEVYYENGINFVLREYD
mgnify:CR=1 FL=1